MLWRSRHIPDRVRYKSRIVAEMGPDLSFSGTHHVKFLLVHALTLENSGGERKNQQMPPLYPLFKREFLAETSPESLKACPFDVRPTQSDERTRQ